MDEAIIKETNKKSFELVLDCVMPYIQDNDELNYVSLVSTTCRDIDSLTRKHVTVHVHYLPNPSRLSHRFPNLESLTLKSYSHGPDIADECNVRVTPWIHEIALKLTRLNSLSIRNMVVSPSDLKRLANTRGGSLTSLEIRGSKMFSEDGLVYVATHCKHLTSLRLDFNNIKVRPHGEWLGKLALHNTVMESLDFHDPFDSYILTDVMKDVIRIAKKCSKSLVSLNASPEHLSDFREVFKHAKKLEHFGTGIINEGWDYSSFKFTQNICGLRIEVFCEASFSFLHPYLNQLRELDLQCGSLQPNCQCFFFKRCPSLEVLYTEDICGDKGFQFIGQFCKKLRKLTHCGQVTHLGLKAVAQGCPDLDFLEVHPCKISNKALECVGTHLKKLRYFRVVLDTEDKLKDSPLDNRIQAMLVGRRNLDNGVRAMLEGCSKLEKLDIDICLGGLTNVGLGYIGKYGHNLRSLSLSYAGESDVGLLELSKGCPKLRKLRLSHCPFSEQAIATFVFNIHSLRYLWAEGNYLPDLVLTRPMVSAEAHDASAVLNFSENCTQDISTPFLDGILSKLLVLLQNGEQMVQEGALTALASVVVSSEEQIQKYYDAVMPNLKAILVNVNDKANHMLRAMAIECISMVGMAAGKDKFKDDAKQLMDVLMSLQGDQMETDDPNASYIYKAWACLYMCLGQDFLPHLAVVMPHLLHSSQLKPENEIESDDESMETITLGDKRIGIKISVLEEKTTACKILCFLAEELKDGFFPWIDQVAPILVPLLKFYIYDEVRVAASSAMPCLLRSSKLAIEKGLALGRDETYLKELSDYMVPALVEALHTEPVTEIIANMLDALNECLEITGPLLDENQVRSIVDEIKQVITASSSLKGERTNAEDFDAEEGELLEEENELEEEVFDKVGKVLGTLVKTFKASFLPFFDELSSYLMPMLGKKKTAEERRIAICIFDDVAKECREAALRYYDTYLPILLEACNDENPDVRTAAVYGLGVCVEHGGSVIKPLIGEALSRLNAVIRHPNALHPDNVMAYDIAVSTLGKVCHFHRDSIDSAQVIPAWLNCLPIKGDKIEAKVVHELLSVMVERSDVELLDPNNQYLPKIVSIFAEILCAGKDLATDQTISRINNLLRQLQQTLPPATLASTWSVLQAPTTIGIAILSFIIITYIYIRYFCYSFFSV